MADFSFIQITDHHLLESEDALRDGFSPAHALRTVLRHIAEHTAHKADFIISSGDLVEPPTEETYQCAVGLLGIKSAAALPGPLKVNVEGLDDYPLYLVPGNHDDRRMLAPKLFGQATCPELYNFAFEHKGVRFIFMDWAEESKAVFPEASRNFLVKALDSDLPSVIICHQHVRPIGSRWLDQFIADDIGQFWDNLLKPGVKERIIGILCGHVHITYEEQYKGIQILGLRSTAFPFARSEEPMVLLAPPHYRFVTIRDNVLTSRIYEVSI